MSSTLHHEFSQAHRAELRRHATDARRATPRRLRASRPSGLISVLAAAVPIRRATAGSPPPAPAAAHLATR
jgi:hypothetical protein